MSLDSSAKTSGQPSLSARVGLVQTGAGWVVVGELVDEVVDGLDGGVVVKVIGGSVEVMDCESVVELVEVVAVSIPVVVLVFEVVAVSTPVVVEIFEVVEEMVEEVDGEVVEDVVEDLVVGEVVEEKVDEVLLVVGVVVLVVVVEVVATAPSTMIQFEAINT